MIPAGTMAPMCEHSAILHRGEHDLTGHLHASMHRAFGEGAEVLLCLDSAAEARVRADFGSMCERFTFRPADDRYANPGMAMAALDKFVAAAQTSGAPAAWSVGAIPLQADGRDARWMQYEEAVHEIFRDRPLRAVCLYDSSATPAHLRHEVSRTHQSVVGEWTDEAADDRRVVDAVDLIPTRPSDLLISNPTPAQARAGMKTMLAASVSREMIVDLQLVTSELVTNAIIHGAAPTVFEAWHEADGCALRVTDSGPDELDRYAHLRPAAGGPEGGFGLWTVGQLADSVDIARHDDVTVVSAYLSLR